MISKDSKFYPCKNQIQTTVHEPLQIRTNKHRCFVFCIGHTSLTCVPGIGKKNKRLLNQSGIHNLSTLYSKYRSIKNIQQFKEWLENDIGFTSYQAKMTTCGICSKLGEIREINTGLTPICCPSRERDNRDRDINKRNRSKRLGIEKNEEKVIKKRKIERSKSENFSPTSNQEQTERTQENLKSFKASISPVTSTSINHSIHKREDLDQSFSSPNNYLTGVKSPDDQILATRSLSMKNKEKSFISQEDTSSSRNKISFDENNKSNEMSETSPNKLNSSSIINETTRVSSESLKPTKQNIPSPEKRGTLNIHSSKLSVSHDHPKFTTKSERSVSNSKLHISTSEQRTTDVSSKMNSKLFKSESYSDQPTKVSQSEEIAINEIQTNISLPQQFDSILPSESSEDSKYNDDKNKSETSQTIFDDSHSKFNQPIEKQTHSLFSSHASMKNTDNNKSEGRLSSKENASVSSDHFDNSSNPEKNFEEKQKPSINSSMMRTGGLTTVKINDSSSSKPSSDNRIAIQIFNEQTKDRSFPTPTLNDETTKDNSTTDEKLKEIFASNKKQSQPTINALQDKNDEILFASKNTPNSLSGNELLRKSILRSVQSESTSQFNPDILFAAIKQQQSTQNISNKTTESSEEDWIKNPLNYGVDAGIKIEPNGVSLNKISDRSISTIKRSYASLPISTPAVFPSKPVKKSNISSSIKLIADDNVTSKTDRQALLDLKLNTTNITSPSSDSPLTTKETHEQHEELTSRPIKDANNQKQTTPQFLDKTVIDTLNTQSPITEDKSPRSIFNRFDPLIKHAVHTAQEDSQSSEINSISSIKENSAESSSIHKPVLETKDQNDTVQSKTLPSKQGDEYRTTPSKCIPLAERLAQAKVKKIAAMLKPNNKDVTHQQLSRQQDLAQKNLLPVTFDRLNQSVTNKSSPNLINRLKNDQSNSDENSKSAQVQQDNHSNNIIEPNKIHLGDKMTNNLMSLSKTEQKTDKIPLVNESIMTQPNLSSSTKSVINDTDSISSATVQNQTNTSQPIQKFPLDAQLLTAHGPYKMSVSKWPTLEEMSNDQDARTEKKSVKQLSFTDRPTKNERLQQKQSNSTSKLATSETTSVDTFPTMNVSDYNLLPNFELLSFPLSSKDDPSTKLVTKQQPLPTTKSSESMKIKPFVKLCNTSQFESISSTKTEDFNRTPNSTGELKMVPSFNNTTTLFTNNKKDKIHTSIIPSNQINQLPLSQNIKENELINNNLSKTTNQKEKSNSTTSKSEHNHQTSTDHQSLSSPAPPLPCSALWDNISNEKILSSRKTHRLITTDPNKSNPKTNQIDYNQNYQSSTTLFTFVTRQQYLKELEALDEHILYIKRIETGYK